VALLQAGDKSESVFSSVISAKLNSRDIRSRIKAIPMEIRRESGNAQGARWREAGIPQGYTVSQLLYNPAAETLILELKALESDVYPKRLFVRHRTSERYEEVGSPGEDISYESPATCEKLPIVMFNSNKHYRPSKGNSGSADWDGTYILNLTTKELTLCLSKENFVVPSPYDERGWVKEVRAISDDGLHAYVIVGLGRRKNAKEVYYDYHFAKLDLGTKQLELITHLKNTFF